MIKFGRFIAMCFMSFSLGLDLGFVLAKGVITCVTILPSLILVCHKAIQRTTHRAWLPDVGRLSTRITKHYKLFLSLFLVLLAPAVYGYTHTEVYYNIDSALPQELVSIQANTGSGRYHNGTRRANTSSGRDYSTSGVSV